MLKNQWFFIIEYYCFFFNILICSHLTSHLNPVYAFVDMHTDTHLLSNTTTDKLIQLIRHSYIHIYIHIYMRSQHTLTHISISAHTCFYQQLCFSLRKLMYFARPSEGTCGLKITNYQNEWINKQTISFVNQWNSFLFVATGDGDAETICR